jgi:hypothetical protein
LIKKSHASAWLFFAQRQKSNWKVVLFHQEHLAGAFDGFGQAALVMSRQPGVFAREDAALICDELLKEDGIFVINGLNGKIDFRFGPGGAAFRGPATAAVSAAGTFVGVGFSGHVDLVG